MLMWDGRIVEARDMILRAFRLNPHPAGWYFWILGMVHYAAGRYDAAIDTLRNEATYRSGSRKVLAAALAMVDRDREARR
ncbi:MAG: adenylate/guanylate cyclase domain-containing protein, partial [Mesorhizobium sp.]